MAYSTLQLIILIIATSIASASLIQSANSNYYTGFIETLGSEVHTLEEDVDCEGTITVALDEFRLTLQTELIDAENILLSVVSLIDKLKYEISPVCRTFYGDFEMFVNSYDGNTEALSNQIQGILEAQEKQINEIVNAFNAFNALDLGEDYEIGTIHANILRMLLGFERSESTESTLVASASITESMEIKAEPSNDFEDYERTMALMNLSGDDDDIYEDVETEVSDENSNSYIEAFVSKLGSLKRFGSARSSDMGELELRDIEDL